MAKYNIGDEVTVHGVITGVDKNETADNTLYVSFADYKGLWLPPSVIAVHMPKPREIKVGDTVRIVNNATLWGVRALSSGEAWLCAEIEGDIVQRIEALKDLRHAED